MASVTSIFLRSNPKITGQPQAKDKSLPKKKNYLETTDAKGNVKKMARDMSPQRCKERRSAARQDISDTGFCLSKLTDLQERLGILFYRSDVKAMVRLDSIEGWFEEGRLEQASKENKDLRVWLELEGMLEEEIETKGWKLEEGQLRRIVRLALLLKCYPNIVMTDIKEKAKMTEEGRRMWCVRPYELIGCSLGAWRKRTSENRQGSYQTYFHQAYREIHHILSQASDHVYFRQ